MNIKYKAYVVVLLCIIWNNAKAQTRDEKDKLIKPFTEVPNYRIGDELPDFGALEVINSNVTAIKTSDFKDRLLILDFWGLTCHSCIEAMPHMETLQKQFGNRIKILPVTNTAGDLVLPFWKKNKYLKNLSLSSIVGAESVFSYFPVSGVPHEVWVYKGKVIGITTADYVDEYNISQVLSGKIPNWLVKNDFYKIDGQKQPLFKLDPKQIDTANAHVRYAQTSNYRNANGVPVWSIANFGIVRDTRHKTVRAYLINQEIFNSYRNNWMNALGYEKYGKFTIPWSDILAPNTVVWEVADKSRYIYEKKAGTYEGDWIQKNGICFESLNSDTGQTDQQVYQSINRDMDRLLGLHVRWEKRKEKVLVLVRTTKEDKLKSKTAVANAYDFKDRYKQTGMLHQIRETGLGLISSYMNQQASNPYVFDETGYKDNVDIDLNIKSWTDIEGIRKSIAPYGLALKEEERLVDKFVFSEVDGSLIIDGQMMTEIKAKKAAQVAMCSPTPEEGKAFLEANKKQAGMVTLPSGLQYKVVKQGTGAKPVLNDILSLRYTCTLVNGKIVDGSDEKGKPLRLPLQNEYGGDTKWLAGLREALKLMPVGSKYILYIPPDLAFQGQTTALDGDTRLPANTTVIFDIELQRIQK